MTQEEIRLAESGAKKKHWKRWGLTSVNAPGALCAKTTVLWNAWEYLPHDHARSRAYRWNEDGLAEFAIGGNSSASRLPCGTNAILSLRNASSASPATKAITAKMQRSYYFYLDSTPTHSYMKHLYKYPQAEFPYGQLVDENRRRGKNQGEFELLDTGVFNDNRYFDVLWSCKATSKTY